MVDVAGFHGIRYDPSKVTLAEASAPPYDVISAAERRDLEALSPHNCVRLILGPLGAPEETKYQDSRALLDRWLAEGVLVRDADPALYVYEETFRVGEDERRQVGVLGAVEISDEVLPHERTMGPVVEDRLAVIRAVEANLSPVFCLYWTGSDDAARAIAQVMESEPYADFRTADGLGHRAWRMTEPAAVEAVAKTLAGATVVIADGHHRYRTAQAYRDERRAAGAGEGPWDRMLLYLVDARRDAPALLPIHRVVAGISAADLAERLAPAFAVEHVDAADADDLARIVAESRATGRCYGILGAGASYLATLTDEGAARAATEGEHSEAWRDLDVAVLHSLVFDRLLDGSGATVTYVHHPAEAAEEIAEGRADVGVLLAPTPVDAVREVAEARDSMPPKSTFFIPKPRTGIVIRPLSGSSS